MGIGAAVAELLAERGANVAIVDRAADEAEALAERLIATGRQARSRCRRRRQRRRGHGRRSTQTVATFGGIDIVSNNAGIQRYGTVETTSEAEWDEVMNVNLKSVYLVCHPPSRTSRPGAARSSTWPRCRASRRRSASPPIRPASMR